MAGTLVVRVCGRTDPGCVRDGNQDYVLVGDLDAREVVDTRDGPCEITASPRGPILVVCDGMGGPAGGEVASELAARVVWSEMREAHATDEHAVVGRLLRRAVRVANRRVYEQGRRERGLEGMGTTLSAAAIAGDAVVVATIGDSRAYLERGGTLTQISRDQSVVSALIHAGQITPEEAKSSANANVILQALGVKKDLEVSLSLAHLRRGDRLLLCSDGLWGPVGDDKLRAILAVHETVEEAAAALISAAREAGGPDNITALVAEAAGDRVGPPANAEDLPRFIELDPTEAGERALATTSRVARRLAARAGIVEDPGGPVVPATGQHMALRGDSAPPAPAARDDTEHDGRVSGPAEAALARRGRLGLVAWTGAIAAAIAVGVVLLWLLFGS